MQQLSKKKKFWAGTAAVLVAGGLFYGVVEYMDTQIMPVEAKSPEEVQQVLEASRAKPSGCRSAEDFVNLNIMLRDIENPQLFNAVLRGLKFENGAVVYPKTDSQPHELVIVKRFLEQANIENEQDLRKCLMFVENARKYHTSQLVTLVQLSWLG